jgi:hypothetical protein
MYVCMYKGWAFSALALRPTMVYFLPHSLIMPSAIPHFGCSAGFYKALDLCSICSFCPEVESGIQLMANRKYTHSVTSGYWLPCIVEYSLYTGRIFERHIKPGRNNSCGRNQTAAGGCCPTFVSVLQAINFCFFRRVISASCCRLKGARYWMEGIISYASNKGWFDTEL